MPQVIVDTATETPASLVLLSRLFQDYAMLKAKDEQRAAHEYPTLSDHTHTVLAPVDVEAAIDRALEADPAKLFAKAAAITAVPAAPVPAPQTAPVAATPAATTVPAATAPSAPLVTLELDSVNVPWDKRIHSSAKGKKQDGTWKLARNIDKALVTMVLQEITPRPHVVDGVVVPAGTAAPVAPPVTVPVAPTVPVPPVAAVGTGGVSDAGGGTVAAAAVPVAPVAPAGGVPVAPNPVQQFQAFMKLVAEGQAAVPPLFTHAAVQAACVAEGLAQIQLVITRPDLIPAIKARLGLV